MRIRQRLQVAILMLIVGTGSALAAPDGVYTRSVELPVDEVYAAVYAALEAERFWVVFEADMGKRMAAMAQRWGDDYNRQNLSAIKAMVFCNIAWTNRIASSDPDLLALCPLHLALYEKDGSTTVTLPRPTAIAAGSPALEQAVALEQELTAIIDQALNGEQ